MRRSFVVLCLLPVLLFLVRTHPLHSQPSGPGQVEVHLPVQAIVLRAEQSLKVRIPLGSEQPIARMFRGGGYVWSVARPGDSRGAGLVLGECGQLSIGDTATDVVVRPYDASIPLSSIRVGDLVSITLEVPEAGLPLIFDIASLAIIFLGDDGLPLYSVQDILADPSDKYQAGVFQRMLNIIHGTAEQLRPVADSDSTFITPMTGGRFRGLSLLDAMERADEEDLKAFLKFVRAYPAKYMGNTWKTDETFATWVLNETPIGSRDLLDVLFASESNAAFADAVNTYRSDIEYGGFLLDWTSGAETRAMNGDIETARNVNSVALVVAEQLRDTLALGWQAFTSGRIAEMELRYDWAEDHYASAVNLFRAIGEIRGESFAQNNHGGVLYSLGRFEEALHSYDLAEALKARRMEADSSSDALGSMAYTVAGKGSVLAAMGDIQKALAAYQRAESLYRDAGALSNAAWALTRSADMLGRLGENEEALSYLEKSVRIYREAGDSAGLADALDATGYQLSSSGRFHESLKKYEQAYAIHLAGGDRKDAGFSQSNLGQVYWSLGDYFNAEKAHRLAILLREEAEDRPGQAYSWHKLGEMFSESGDPGSALDAYEKAASVYRDLGEQNQLAEVLLSTGDVYRSQKSWSPALERYQEALEIFQGSGAEDGVGTALYNIGDTYYSDGQYEKARELFGQSLEVREKIGDRENQIYSHTGLGLAVWNLRDYDGAREHFNKALNLAEELNSRSDVAWCYGVMGRVSSMQGEYETALAEYTKALEIYRKTGERTPETNVLLGIGDILVQQGNFEEGLEQFNSGLKIATQINNRSGIADALRYIAGVYLLLGDFDQAIRTDGKSLQISREVDNPWGIASSFTGLGNTYNAMGNYREAVDYYRRADSIFHSLGDTLGRATPLNNIGTVYFFQGDYEKALDQFNRVLGILRAAGQEDEFLAIVISNIGEVYYEQGRYDDAETWLEQSLELARDVGARRMSASTLAILVKSLMARNQLEEAAIRGQKALELTDEIGEQEQLVEINGVMGELAMRRGDVTAAERYLRKAVEIGDRIHSSKYLWRPLYYLGILNRDRGDREQAITILERSVETIEGLRARVAGGEASQKLFASDKAKVQVYEALIALLIEAGDTERALGYLERSSSEDLRSRFKSLDPSFADPEKRKILEQDREMKARIDNLASQLAAERNEEGGGSSGKIERLQEIISIAENDYIKFVNETVREQPELRNYFSAGVNPIELRQRKQKIPSDVAVVSYLLGERQLFTFVATSDTVVARVLSVERLDVESKVHKLYKSVVTPDRVDDFVVASSDLYDLLVAPIEDRIGAYDKLAIIPSGDLHYVPFATLRPSEPGASYLAEQHTIFYVSDLGVFLDDQGSASDLRLVAFGNADGTLPNAEQEVNDIAAIYPDSKVYVREQATEQKAKHFPQGYNALHFATHGNLDYRHFENSWLTLSADSSSDEDGRLTLEEIWAITNLVDCKLVTLSACNTAVSDEVVEGWPINPANAFLQVGVPRVIATLWQVDDKATARLMTSFYELLPEHGAAESLRRAQESLRSDPAYVHPYYWGPFVLLGDWR